MVFFIDNDHDTGESDRPFFAPSFHVGDMDWLVASMKSRMQKKNGLNIIKEVVDVSPRT